MSGERAKKFLEEISENDLTYLCVYCFALIYRKKSDHKGFMTRKIILFQSARHA